jgi:hypothetical protein
VSEKVASVARRSSSSRSFFPCCCCSCSPSWREAAVTGDETAIEDAAARAAPGLDPARLQVAVERAGTRGTPVTVSVSYEVPVVAVLAGWLFPSSVTLDSVATARQEFG